MTEKCKCNCHKVEKYTCPILGDQFFCDCEFPHNKDAECDALYLICINKDKRA